MVLAAGILNAQQLLAGNASGKKITKIVVGTSDTPVSDTDSALTSPVAKDIISINYLPGGIVQFNSTLDAGDPTMTIKEMGLLNQDNVLVYRKLITPVNKVGGVVYALSYKIKVQ